MSAKVLVADDSLTIQKVIAITLSSTGYELIGCHNEEELFDQLNQTDFDLVLLDFNLSDESSGYDLAKEIKLKKSSVPILAMLGTFDSVDEDQLRESGVTDKIVKPFESDSFISKCQELLESESDEYEAAEEFVSDSLDDDGDEWVVDEPQSTKDRSGNFEKTAEFNLSNVTDDGDEEESLNPLHSELEGWGIEIPGVIGKGGENIESPPIIQEPMNQENVVLSSESEEESIFPDDEDSQYPDSDDLDFPDSEIESTKKRTSFVSLDDLADDEEEIDSSFVSEDLEKSISLENQIEDDVNPDDFWAVDEASNTGTTHTAGAIADPEIKKQAQINDSPKAEPSQIESNQAAQVTSPDLNEEKILDQLLEKLQPVIESKVQERVDAIIERIAWETIPDLAENLIKKELRSISESVKQDLQ